MAAVAAAPLAVPLEAAAVDPLLDGRAHWFPREDLPVARAQLPEAVLPQGYLHGAFPVSADLAPEPPLLFLLVALSCLLELDGAFATQVVFLVVVEMAG